MTEVAAKDLDIQLSEGAELRSDSFITCKGVNNVLSLGRNARVGELGRPRLDFIGDNNRIEIAESAVLKRGHLRLKGNNMVIKIGQNTTINGVYILCLEGASVSIGDDCMLSYGIEIRTSDAHSVLDAKTDQRVNHAKDVVIGDHVWVGKDVLLMPGVHIANDVIIGIRALVTKSVEQSQVVVGGIPASVIQHNRTWDRRLL